jgi:uroporphyrinogen-III synthase
LNLSRAGALAFTSRNAVTVFAAIRAERNLPVYATGQATAAAARKAGFERVASADGGIAELAELIIKQRPGVEVVWPGPLEPAGDLVALLAAGGVKASLQPIYESVAVGAAAPPRIDAVLVHSPKGGRAVAQVVDADLARTMAAFAISSAAAAPLADLPFARVAVAPRPNETALLSLIAG